MMIGPITDERDERVERALAAIAIGQPVVVRNDDSQKAEGNLVFAAELASSRLMAFTVRFTSGFVCVALTHEECDRLALPPMRPDAGDRPATACAVTVDAIGTSTGISAADRAATIRALGSSDSTPGTFRRPGHVVPLRASRGGILSRRGHAEAAVDLVRLAGLRPAAAFCEIVSQRNPHGMAHRAELVDFAAEHGLEIISIAELAAYRRHVEPQVVREVTANLPTAHGGFRAVGYRSLGDDAEAVALVMGEVEAHNDVTVHVHIECPSGDILGSLQCGCRAALTEALGSVSSRGRGVVVYLRRPARAGALLDTLRTYHALDTAGGVAELDHLRERKHALPDFETAAHILLDLGVRSARVVGPMSAQLDELHWHGIRTDREPSSAPGAAS
jgi:3,4-dihydroxy 2-butanone 4-phosphate synthase/GTP cyclohydrolase II